MTKRIKPYNHTYKVAARILREEPKTELTHLVIQTMQQLNPKYNYSKEGTKRAWNDFKKNSLKRLSETSLKIDFASHQADSMNFVNQSFQITNNITIKRYQTFNYYGSGICKIIMDDLA